MVEQTSVRTFIIAALIFTAVLTGAMSIISLSVPDSQSTADFERYNRSYNRFSEIEDDTVEIRDNMETAEPTQGLGGIISGAWDATWQTVNLVWSSVTVMGDIVGDLSDGSSLSMPSWFTALLIGIITITVTFAIIASIRKWYI